MNLDLILRIGSLCLLLACAETLHGIARTLLITPRLGKERALKLSAITGSVLAFGICALQVPGIGIQSAIGHLALGGGLALFMAAFDMGIGRFVMHKPWRKIWPDFDPRTGNYLLYGLVCLGFTPWAVWLLQSGTQ